MGRKNSAKRRSWRRYAIATVLLAAIAVAAWYWWEMKHWAPDEAIYPDQGVAVDQANGLVGFDTVRALGGKFAYVAASAGAGEKDTRFARNVEAAARAGLKTGAIHIFDPCSSADRQSANFARIVPRNPELLPPVIALDKSGTACPERVSDARVESELMTLVNQIEMHVGKRAILKIYPGFEREYGLAQQLDRDLWLVRDRFVPDYGGRPWLLWSANTARVTEASDEPLEWVVVQP